MTQPCFIYARYSSLEQGRGLSLKRQLEIGRQYAERKGWLLDPDREIVDKGRSAFTQANRAEGSELWAFEQQVAKGFYRNGAVFLTEHFDRVSRAGWEEIYGFLKLMTENGVSVATIDGDRLYPAGKRINPAVIMELVFKAEGARDESDKKSRRGLHNWQAKIEAIQAGDKRVNIGLPPAWIQRDPKTNEFSLNPHRVAVLREVFDLYADGWGLPAIVRKLNGRGEPSWGYKGRNKGNGWNSAYLGKLLKNRAVLGEYEPMSRTHGGINESSKGIRVPDFYPQAIPADVFNRAQAVKSSRRFTGGPGEAVVNNLFGGSAFCAACGGPMYYQNQIKAGGLTAHKSRVDGRPLAYRAKTARSYLLCNNNRRLHECKNSARVRYEYLEPAVLDAVLAVVIDDKRFTLTDEVAALSANVAELERLIEGKRHNLNSIVDSLAEYFVKALAAKAQAIEAEIDADQARLTEMQDELRRKQGAGSPAEQLNRVREVRASVTSEDKEARYSARARVRQALSQLIRINCDLEGIATVVVGDGLMAWRFDRQGKLLDSFDLTNRLDLHQGLTTGELASNAPRVAAVLKRKAAA